MTTAIAHPSMATFVRAKATQEQLDSLTARLKGLRELAEDTETTRNTQRAQAISALEVLEGSVLDLTAHPDSFQRWQAPGLALVGDDLLRADERIEPLTLRGRITDVTFLSYNPGDVRNACFAFVTEEHEGYWTVAVKELTNWELVE